MTLASLVERETPRPEERPHVAGVFENRLRIGQPLQCDPTVAYALTLAGAYSGKLAGGDLHFASPYNTYRNRGLPPGPIANPGEAALRAALDPPPTEDLYFVANTEGGHFFSKTLQEHNQNVARYRRLLEESQNPPAERRVPSPPRREQIQACEVAMTHADHPTKKELILEIARELSVPRFTPAEVEQIRRQLVARLGASGKLPPTTSPECWKRPGCASCGPPRPIPKASTRRNSRTCSISRPWKTRRCASCASMSCTENSRKRKNAPPSKRVFEVARMGRRRAEMIARNHKVEPEKRAEKEEIMQWFKVWLDTPDAFFDWLEVRKVFAGFPEALREERIGRTPERAMADLHYVMEVEPLDLGADVKAVGLDLMEVESREPARGADAARIWAATLGALPGTEPWALDFFAHLDRVREYCRLHERHV